MHIEKAFIDGFMEKAAAVNLSKELAHLRLLDFAGYGILKSANEQDLQFFGNIIKMTQEEMVK